MRIAVAMIFSLILAVAGAAQQSQPTPDTPQKPKQSKETKEKGKKEPPAPGAIDRPDESAKPGEPSKSQTVDPEKDKEERYDVSEVAPIVTHHQATVNGKTFSYTATAGRLPLKREDGKIEAEMFFV